MTNTNQLHSTTKHSLKTILIFTTKL